MLWSILVIKPCDTRIVKNCETKYLVLSIQRLCETFKNEMRIKSRHCEIIINDVLLLNKKLMVSSIYTHQIFNFTPIFKKCSFFIFIHLTLDIKHINKLIEKKNRKRKITPRPNQHHPFQPPPPIFQQLPLPTPLPVCHPFFKLNIKSVMSSEYV